jgi:hypothetical protein
MYKQIEPENLMGKLGTGGSTLLKQLLKKRSEGTYEYVSLAP